MYIVYIYILYNIYIVYIYTHYISYISDAGVRENSPYLHVIFIHLSVAHCSGHVAHWNDKSTLYHAAFGQGHLSHEKKEQPLAFHCTGCLIGIHNSFFFFIAHLDMSCFFWRNPAVFLGVTFDILLHVLMLTSFTFCDMKRGVLPDYRIIYPQNQYIHSQTSF